MKFLATLAALAAFSPMALALEKGDCGTIVLPSGGGAGPGADITSFNPLFSDSAYNQQASWLLYPNLLWINRFSRIDWSRSLASAVTTTDGQNFLITLRPWHWSDGVPVSAEDVAYYFDLGKALGPSWPQYGFGGLPFIVKSVKILGPEQLLITTTHPVNPDWFIMNGIATLEPLPQHAWQHYTADQMLQLQSSPGFFGVVDGPLELLKLDVGLDAIFIPNPRWEGPKLHFSRLVLAFVKGDGAGVQGVESGDMDAGNVPTGLLRGVRNTPGVHIEILPQETYQNVIVVNFRNPRAPFFGDVRVRQAMIDAIDQKAIVKQLEQGAGDTAYGPVPQSFTTFLTPAMKQGVYPVGYNPAEAIRLLEAAGYRRGPDGIMVRNGKRLAFNYLLESGSDAVIELDETLQADLRRVGIEMNIHLVEFNQLLALMNGPPENWEATGIAISVQAYPTGEGQFKTGAYQNSGGYSDAEMDQLIEDSVTKPGIERLYAYETYTSTQQPVIFGPRARPVLLVRNRLHGMSDFINPATMFAPDQLYCSEEGSAE